MIFLRVGFLYADVLDVNEMPSQVLVEVPSDFPHCQTHGHLSALP